MDPKLRNEIILNAIQKKNLEEKIQLEQAKKIKNERYLESEENKKQLEILIAEESLIVKEFLLHEIKHKKLLDKVKDFYSKKENFENLLLNNELNRQKFNEKKKLLTDFHKLIKDDDDDHVFDDDFTGNDWFLPKINKEQWSTYINDMDFSEDEKEKWLLIFEDHQRYHQQSLEGASQYIQSYLHYYFPEGGSGESPRETLHRLIIAQLSGLKDSFSSVKEHIISNIKKNNKGLADACQQRDDSLRKFEILTKKKTEIEVKKSEVRQNVSRLNNESSLLELQYQLKKDYYSLQLFEKLRVDFNTLISAQPELLTDGTHVDIYDQVMDFQGKVEVFSHELTDALQKTHFIEINKNVDDKFFKLLGKTKDYVALKNRLALITQLEGTYSELNAKYHKLHDEYFEKHQFSVVEAHENEIEKKILFEAEITKKKGNVQKYLGDSNSPGYLLDYLSQRNATYWWLDGFSFAVSFFLNLTFSYVTEKQRRTDFIKIKLRPALFNFQKTGCNLKLEKVLCQSPALFFKPRTREGAGYSLTLESLLDDIRKEVLTNEQLMTYHESNEEKETSRYCGCF